MIKILVNNAVRFGVRDVPDDVLVELTEYAKHRDPVYRRVRHLGRSTKGLTRFISTYKQVGDTLVFWRGMLGRIRREFKRAGVKFKIDDRRTKVPTSRKLVPSFELYDYQRLPVKVMRRRQQTLGRGLVGCGKTEMILYLMTLFQYRSLVLIWTEAQQKTWLERIPTRLNVAREEIGGFGGVFPGVVIKDINVGLVHTLVRNSSSLAREFGFVACDEVQRFGAATFAPGVNTLHAAVRVGCSDDERRKDRRTFLLHDTFGPVGWRLTSEEVGEKSLPVSVLVKPTKFELAEEDLTLDTSSVITKLTKDRQRNRGIVSDIVRAVKKGHHCIVWSERVKHCRVLQTRLRRRGVGAMLLIGGSDLDEVKDAFKAGKCDVVIGTTPAETSINILTLDRGFVTCGTADEGLKRFRQMAGRISRPNPNDDSKTAVMRYYWDYQVDRLNKRVHKRLRKTKRFKVRFLD